VGAAAVHPDATAPGLRPRELDRSARRDLAALLRRQGLAFTGLDLWIPPPHFHDSAHVDRATAALAAAADLAVEIAALAPSTAHAAPVVCVELPETLHPDAARLLAAGLPCAVADFRRPATPRGPGAAAGFDPAPVLLAGGDPAAELLALPAPSTARIADADAGGRCPVGKGRLRISDYQMACAASGARPLVLDLRGLDQPEAAARAALSAWATA
jgi:hypothetical protein